MHLLFKRIYLVVGVENTSMLFNQRTSGLTTRKINYAFIKALLGPPPEEDILWKDDDTGRFKTPAPGTEHKQRMWVHWHNSAHQFMNTHRGASDLAKWYYKRFQARMDTIFSEEETCGKFALEMGILKFVQTHVTETAAEAFGGEEFLKKCPEYLQVMRECEAVSTQLVFGPPKWLNPGPWKIRQKWFDVNETFMNEALPRWKKKRQELTEKGQASNKWEWDPILGCPYSVALVEWSVNANHSPQTSARLFGAGVMAQNGNTIPAIAWAMMLMLTCPDAVWLQQEIRKEAEATIRPNIKDGATPEIDIKKLCNMPVSQAVYAETLRLKSAFNITRDATRDVEFGGVKVEKGSWIQAPQLLAHLDPIWEEAGHPPTEFWPFRFLTIAQDEITGEKKQQFEMKGERGSYWFPFSGGFTMCPGRGFAKQEMILTVAMMVMMFEFEVVGWETLDGKPSSQPAGNKLNLFTFAPDRELKVKVRRR